MINNLIIYSISLYEDKTINHVIFSLFCKSVNSFKMNGKTECMGFHIYVRLATFEKVTFYTSVRNDSNFRRIFDEEDQNIIFCKQKIIHTKTFKI